MDHLQKSFADFYMELLVLFKYSKNKEPRPDKCNFKITFLKTHT